jgi:hypothetical protein
MASTPKKPGIKVEDVCFYFDAVERDRQDAAGASRKTAEVLALRDRLVRLSDVQFDAAMKTLRSLVEEGQRAASDGPSRTQGARQLYEDARLAGRAGGGGGGSTGKVSPA